MKWVEILDYVVDNEGGYVNNPDDPGGETKYGITKRQYPNLDIPSITRADAVGIISQDYGRIPYEAYTMGETALALVMLDTCVNVGEKRLVTWLQQALRRGLAVDGKYGPLTRAAFMEALEEGRGDAIILDITLHRLRHYTELSTFKTFGRGWVRRVVDLLERGMRG